VAQLAVVALLISLLAACASTPAVQSPTTLPTVITTSAPIGASAATATPTGDSSVRSADAAIDAIKQVIQQSNQEQQQALAAHNPALMRDTATSTYYSQAVQGLTDLLNTGVSEIQLVKLDWGPIALQGTTSAQATTSETWRTTFSDGSTLQQLDTNVYTLVLEGDAWKVQDDQHPDSQRVPRPQAPQTTAPAPVAPDPAEDVSQSRNWAGYAASGGTFTAVSGTWTVPSVSAGRTAAGDATWVGIGGVSSRDLIQAGTDATVQSGRVRYTAWIELLPQAAIPVPLVVSAGDTVSVAITEQSSDTWQILIRNTTTGQSYQKRVAYASSHSSAEWVEEAPAVGQRTLLPLDNFGTIRFTDATTVEDGQTHSIAQAGGQAITMSSRTGQPAAQPSALGDDGASFSVTRTNTPTSSIS
jgi:hypothetical protein